MTLSLIHIYLPGVLPQNSDACAGLCGQSQEGILRRNGLADVLIIPGQIEIGTPDTFPGVLITADPVSYTHLDVYKRQQLAQWDTAQLGDDVLVDGALII